MADSANPAQARYYPPINFQFSVRFLRPSNPQDERKKNAGLSEEYVTFQSISGLNVQMQTESLKEGAENRFEHILPVRSKYSDLVLKRGLVFKSPNVLVWLKKAFEEFKFEPWDLQITMLDIENKPLVKWDVTNAWPKAWKFSEFNAMEGKVFIETLELSYNYFRMEAA